MMFDAHGASTVVIDMLRYVVVAYGAVLTGWVAGKLVVRRDRCPEGVALHVCLVVLWGSIWLPIARQVGHAWLYWRLPLALVAIPVTIWVIHRHRVTHHRRHRRSARRVATGWWLRAVLRSESRSAPASACVRPNDGRQHGG